MSREKMPDNLQDFTTMYLQKPIQKIIEELYTLKVKNRELEALNLKLANMILLYSKKRLNDYVT